MEVTPYKEKVFDQDVLLLVIHLFDFIEKKNVEKSFLKQLLTDAVGFSNKTSDLVYLLQSFLLIAKEIDSALCKEILDANSLMGKTRCLDEYCSTIQHISEARSFTAWPDFFRMLRNVTNENSNMYPLILEAVRHSVQHFQTSTSFKGIFRTLSEIPQHAGAFAYGQLDSKKWLIEEAIKVWGKDWGTVFVLAGWIGLLPRMMWDQEIRTNKIRSFDIDDSANKASELLNQAEVQTDWLYKSSTKDITEMSYPTTYNVQRKDGTLCELIDSPDIIINTSCEHIADINAWLAKIPKGTKVILQSNDGFHIAEHVACFKTLNDFENAMQLSKVEYRGEKALPEFNRFMLIGEK